MHIGLLIYGSLDTLTGGYLYDRLLCRELEALGDQITIFSLPWRNYGRHLTDNFSRDLYHSLRQAPLDVLIQDELNHPSLVGLNYLLRRRADYPLVSLIHLLRHTEPRPAWQQWGYRQVERLYLASVDGFIYNSRDSQQLVEELVGPRPGVVGYPGKDHLPTAVSPRHIIRRAHQPGPLRLIYRGQRRPAQGAGPAAGRPGPAAAPAVAADRHWQPGNGAGLCGRFTGAGGPAWSKQQRALAGPTAQ
jgi:hypothetical protein